MVFISQYSHKVDNQSRTLPPRDFGMNFFPMTVADTVQQYCHLSALLSLLKLLQSAILHRTINNFPSALPALFKQRHIANPCSTFLVLNMPYYRRSSSTELYSSVANLCLPHIDTTHSLNSISCIKTISSGAKRNDISDKDTFHHYLLQIALSGIIRNLSETLIPPEWQKPGILRLSLGYQCSRLSHSCGPHEMDQSPR